MRATDTAPLLLALGSAIARAQSSPAPAEPQRLLRGRLTIQLPSTPAAAAADPGEGLAERLRLIEATRHVREAYGAETLVACGAEWVLLRAFETGWLAGEEFGRRVETEAKRQERADPARRTFRVDAVPLRDKTLQAFAISPSQLAPGDMDPALFADFAWALTAYVVQPDHTVAQVTFHVRKGDANSSERARAMAATIAPGTVVRAGGSGRRDLPIRNASTLSCDLPAGYALESWDTVLTGDLTIHLIRKLMPFGQPRPTLALRYVGHSWLADAGPLVGSVPLGYGWRKEANPETGAWPTGGLPFAGGGFSSFSVTCAAPDNESLGELMRIADSLRVVPGQERPASRPAK